MNSKIYQIGHVVVLALISMVFFPSCEKSEKEKALEEIAQIDGELIELIENGARVDAMGEDGRTALMRAASRGDTDCVRALLKAGEDVYEK